MSFIDDIRESFCSNELRGENSFRVVMFGQNAIYLERIKRITCYQPDKMTVNLKKGRMVISGKDMYIKKYCLEDVVVCGKIEKIEIDE